LETKHDKLLQIVLFGQPELDTNLNQINIRQLRERITHSFNLGPLTAGEVGEYLMFRLRAAGYFGPHLFSKSAIRLMAKSSEGLVRRVNILADKALLATFSDNSYQVTPKYVRAAIKDSEFGAEQVKKAGKQHSFLAAAVIMLVGLGLGYLMNVWPLTSTPIALSAQRLPVSVDTHETELILTTEYLDTAIINAEPKTVDKGLPAAELANDLLLQRLNVTQRWLRQQPSSTISIQLMSGANADLLRTQLESLASKVDVDRIYVYPTQVGGGSFLTVLYGAYETRHEALIAMKALPEFLRHYKPHLRTVGGVVQEIASVK
jgi:MSHA biogenesis protein MshM